MAKVSVQSHDFDVSAEISALTSGRTDIGAIGSFIGLCRDEGGRLAALELEHYPGMAEAELGRVVAEAEARWPLLGVTVIHRYGKIAPGGQIVLVLALSAHRVAALQATEFLMDFLKTRAPFWKKEHFTDGTSGGWVAPKASDDAMAGRWN